jgi:hypothetical protein
MRSVLIEGGDCGGSTIIEDGKSEAIGCRIFAAQELVCAANRRGDGRRGAAVACCGCARPHPEGGIACAWGRPIP